MMTQLQKAPRFGATYKFNINPETDFSSEAKATAETLTSTPLMRSYTTQQLYQGPAQDDIFELNLGEPHSEKYPVSVYLNKNNQLVVNTPKKDDDNLAQESTLIKALLTEAGITADKIKAIVLQVLNSEEREETVSPAPEADKTVKKHAPIKAATAEFEVINSSYTTLPKEILDCQKSSLCSLLVDFIKAGNDEDSILKIINGHPKFTELSEEYRYVIMDEAAKKGFLKIIHACRKVNTDIKKSSFYGSSENIQETAVQHGQTKVLDYLLQQGYDFSPSSLNGPKLMKEAVLYQQLDVLKYLVNQGVNPQDKDPFNSNNQALHFVNLRSSLKTNQSAIFKYLADDLKLPLQISDTDPDGYNFLFYATKNVDIDLFKRIFSKFDKKDLFNHPNSIAITAAEYGKEDIFKYLEKEIPELVNKPEKSTGRNAYFYAAINGHDKLIDGHNARNQRDLVFNTIPHVIVPLLYDKKTPDGKKEGIIKILKKSDYLYQFSTKNNKGQTVWDMVPKKFGKEKSLKKKMGVN